jgi:hypothetical protein
MKKGGKHTDKKPLIVVSICVVVLLVLASLSNVVGYQTVQTSQQNLIKERINQKELLFQTIVDIVNNKEIQQVLLKSQMSKGIRPASDIPVLTKNQLRQMYFFGLILSKVISKSRMQSMVQQYQVVNPEIQKEISIVIEKDAALNDKMTQLQNSECNCEHEKTSSWTPILLCVILYVICLVCEFLYEFFFALVLGSMYNPIIFLLFIVLGGWIIGYVTAKLALYIGNICFNLGVELNCWPEGP